MKQNLRYLLSVASAAIALQQASAQAIILKEDFEGNALPTASGWVAHDADGDGHGWQVTNNGMFEMAGSSRCIAISFARDPQNYTTVYGAQDNWLVTPAFKVTNETVALEFEYCAQDLEQVEPIEVLLSEGGSEIADFTVSLWKTTVDNGYEDEPEINTKKLPLTDYVGKTVRIAFRHKTSGTYGLSIDNVTVNNQNGPNTPKWYEATADKNGGNSVYLKWLNPDKTTNGDDLSEVSTNIYRDGVKIHTVTGQAPGSDGEWTDTSVTPGKYIYTITAFTEEGETRQISGKTVMVGEDVSAPIEQTFALAGDNKVTVTWAAPTKGANSTYSTPTVFNPANVKYILKRAVDGGEFAELAADLTATSYTDTNVEGGKTYTYTVQAQNPAGISEVLEGASVYVSPAGTADIAIAVTTERVNRSERVPFDLTDEYDVTQSLYFPEELQYARGDIKSIIYKTYRSQASTVDVPVRIYLCETEKAEFSDKQWVDLAQATLAYEGTMPFVQGTHDTKIDLSTPYNYKGGNLVVTVIKDGKPNGSYSDCFFTIVSDKADRSMTTSTYSKVDASSLPHSSYSDKPTANVASVRFIVDLKDTGSLFGKITDSASGKALEGATVSVADVAGLSVTTNAQGEYKVPYIPVGSHKVLYEAVGYISQEKEMQISEAAASQDAQLVRLANYTLKGNVKAADTSLPAKGAVVTLSGYEDISTTVGANGSWALQGVYSGKDYAIAIIYPGYDTYTSAINNESQGEVAMDDVLLSRSLIPPFAVAANVAADGSSVALAWKNPLEREGVPGEKPIGDVSTVYSDNGDYSSSDYSVAHYYDASTIAELNMAGLSVTGLKVYLLAKSGTFTAHVWEGDRNDHTILASKEIPAEQLTGGNWVEVVFDEPVEIKADGKYMIGVNCKNADTRYPFGTAPSASYISGKNNIKFSEEGYLYDGYSAWCIIASCGVPASPSGISENENAPDCAYNVYRGTVSDENTTWEKISSTPVRETSFTDEGWDKLSSGAFVYGVTAVYQNGESMKAYSSKIQRSNDTDVAVTAFVSPTKSVDARDNVTVAVTITNLGEKPASDIPVALLLNGEEVAKKTLSATINKGESADVDFGSVAIAEGIHSFTAVASLEGDVVSSNDELTLVLPNKENVELTAYRWSAYGNAGFMKIQSNNPEAADFRKEFTTDLGLIVAAEYLEGKIYAYTATWYQAPQEFIEIDPVTWSITNLTDNEDTYILDMAYDYSTKTMYGLEPANDDVDLVKINLADGSTTVVGGLGQVVRAIACDKDGKLYGIAESGKLISIDAATATATEIGDTGFGSAIYLQSMCFDHRTGRLFWAATNDNTSGEIREIDPATGESRPMGLTLYRKSEPSEMVGMHTPFVPEVDGIGAAGFDAQAISIEVAYNGTLAITTAVAANAEVYSADGACVKRLAILPGTTECKIQLAAGVYIIKATDTNGATAVRKFSLR